MALTEVASAEISDLAEAVRGGDCTLFLGSAVHAPPPSDSVYTYAEDQRPELASQLMKRLADGCDFSEKLPNESPTLQRVALCYELMKGRNRLVDEVRAGVHIGKRPSPILNALAQLDFPLIVTTNYDQLFETALTGATKQPRKLVYNPDKVGTPAWRVGSTQEPIVCKLHGDVDNRPSIVITDTDYIQFVLRMSDPMPLDPIPITVRSRFTSSPILFLGYSLLDFNLRLLFKTLRWQADDAEIPDTYAVDRAPDPLISAVWGANNYVRFVVEDVWAFVPELYRRVRGEEMPV
jgi:hypothetical protein